MSNGITGCKYMKEIDVNIAYRLLATGAVIIVSAEHGGTRGCMTCAWNMPLDYNPSKIALVMSKESDTRKLLEKSKQFVIGIPGKAMKDKVLKIGSCHSGSVDKFADFGLGTSSAKTVKAPVPEGCLAYLECSLIDEPSIADKYDLLLAEVKSAYAQDGVFEDGLLCSGEDTSVLHHVSGGKFMLDGKVIGE